MTESLRTAPELAYLESFRAVCEAGSFTAAARLLGCSQPAVSYQIRNLEECFGVTLFERGGRRVVLTAEGRRLSTFVEGLFTRLAEVRHECAGAYAFEPLRLGSASGFGRYVLMPALHGLVREEADGMPEIRLEFEAADVLLDRLEQGRYEGVFVYKRRISSALAYERVCLEELVLVAPPDMAAGRTDLADLQRLPFVTYEECEYVFGRWFDAVFGSQPTRLTSRASFTELEEVLDFVAAGVGVSIVPRDAAIARCARGEVAVIRPRGAEACLNDVYFATRAGSDVRPVVRRLIGLIRSSVANDDGENTHGSDPPKSSRARPRRG